MAHGACEGARSAHDILREENMNIIVIILNIGLFFVCAIALAALVGLLLSIVLGKIDEHES